MSALPTMQGRATGLSDAEIDSKDDIELAAPGESAPQEPTALNRKNPLAVYDTRRKRVAFWAAFLTFTVALAIASDTTYLYLSFATSFFAQNSLLGTIGLLTSVLGAVTQPFWGKLADMSARSVSLLASLLLFVLGYVICAAATSVKAIAAGQVIYNIGSTGLSFLQSLIVADATSLQSRGIAYGIISMIFLPFAFVGPNIATGIGLTHWRWGYGMFCILMPVCTAPLWSMLAHADLVRHKQTRAARTPHSADVSASRRIARALAIIDPVGLILVGFAFSLLLVPPTLYAGAKGGWRNPSMIAMEVVGGVILIMFVVWEWRFAPHPLMPRRMFTRNFGLCFFVTIVYFLNASIYTTYWVSWLWVVQDYDQRQWTYVCETGTAALCVFTLVAGLIIRYTKRYKAMLIAGVATSCVGAGINYYTARPGRTSSVAVVFGQLLYQGGAGFALTPAQSAFQGSVRSADLAMAIAIYIFSESMGNAIGASIAGGLWTDTLVSNLAIHAPGLNATEILAVAGDITVARITEPRAGIIEAYDITYRKQALATLVLTFVPFFASFFLEDFALDARHNAVEEPESGGDETQATSSAALDFVCSSVCDVHVHEDLYQM